MAMASIQLALDNPGLADALQGMLRRNTDLPVRRVERPDEIDDGVVVVDIAHLGRLGTLLAHPERVVLIASKDANNFDDAWQAGVSSVVSDQDPLNTVVLAILSACLRTEPRAADGPEKKLLSVLPNKEIRR
ncbi:MAG: hypothetical protein IT161_12920 [Bryobacterales bacterium]|nr:hypothetical protein [Bryobacterales bacterium]